MLLLTLLELYLVTGNVTAHRHGGTESVGAIRSESPVLRGK